MCKLHNQNIENTQNDVFQYFIFESIKSSRKTEIFGTRLGSALVTSVYGTS